ncbi:MAG: NAD-dependent epimerase/dehydratase family protein [Patescibacteria group bacterium]|nr:NAD-dependent epimerase/dehydratase family protein [Patescibacteria group bacterium]MDE1946112.1 NAD-dependent epimerase/dehydratase family protein [Patescibacteria group bacterium]
MQQSKIIILGNGFLANRLKEENGWTICSDRIESYRDLEAIVRKHVPKVIVCAIGFTGASNVDDCEKDIDRTIQANTVVPIYLAELSFRFPDVHILDISTGCMFADPDREYDDDDIGDYDALFYSRTKIYAEEMLKYPARQGRKISICRIRLILDWKSSAKNALDKLIRYKTIIDIPNSLTYVPTMCRAFDFIIANKVYGVINIVNDGTLRYPKLLDEYKKYVPSYSYEITTLKKLGIDRTNVRLLPRRLAELGFKNETVDEVVRDCVKRYVETARK